MEDGRAVADRRNYFHGQVLQEGELDAGFNGLEAADWNLATDLGLVGVAGGGVVTQHSPTPDLTVDVTSVRAYDQQGRRIEFPSTQTPSLATDSNSVSTAVANGGNSKIVSLFVRFKRDQSDPRTDDNAVPLNFVQDEGFEFVVVQGAEAASPTPPALLSDGILLADVTRTFGQTQIVNGDISTARRQDMFVGTAGSIGFRAGTPEEALQDILTELNNHITGVSNLHPATAISAAAVSQSPTSLSLGTVSSQLAALLTAVNARARLASAETVAGAWTFNANRAFHPVSDVGELQRVVELFDVNQGINSGGVDHFRVPVITGDKVDALADPAADGRVLTFTKPQATATYTWTLRRADTTVLVTFDAASRGSVTVISDGGVWKILSVEVWGGTVSSVNSDV